jgi:hypothetical protein
MPADVPVMSAVRLAIQTPHVMRGHSRSKNGVASLAYGPRIHEARQRKMTIPMWHAERHHGLPGQARQ